MDTKEKLEQLEKDVLVDLVIVLLDRVEERERQIEDIREELDNIDTDFYEKDEDDYIAIAKEHFNLRKVKNDR